MRSIILSFLFLSASASSLAGPPLQQWLGRGETLSTPSETAYDLLPATTHLRPLGTSREDVQWVSQFLFQLDNAEEVYYSALDDIDRYEAFVQGGPNRGYSWFILDSEGNRAGLIIIDKRGEISWFLDVASRRQGLATKALEDLLPLLPSLGINKLTACIPPKNLSSANLAKRLGFKKVKSALVLWDSDRWEIHLG